MKTLDIPSYAVFGWSLGGHIALDMLAQDGGILGVMITGSPPIGQDRGAIHEGFAGNIESGGAAKRVLSEEEIDGFAHGTCGANAPYDPLLEATVRRTDGRSLMVAKMSAGLGRNQCDLAVNSKVPLAIVDGAQDPFLNHDYIRSLPYKNLWEGKVHELAGLDRVPFWEGPKVFDQYLDRFLKDLSKATT